jgi:hypothetical protein
VVTQLENLVISLGISQLYSAVSYLMICDAEPSTYALATSNASGYMIGSWSAGASSIFGAPVSVANGMSVATNSCNSAGTIFHTGTASWWAAVSDASLYAHGTLSSPQAVTNTNPFSRSSFSITMPGHA